MLSHSNSFGNDAEKDTAGCRALNRKYIVIEGYDEIIVPEELGKKIMMAKKVKKLSPLAIGALAAVGAVEVGVTAVAPPVGAMMAAPTIATGVAVAGVDIAAIALISGVGLMALTMLWDDYAKVNVANGFFYFERKRKAKGKSKSDD